MFMVFLGFLVFFRVSKVFYDLGFFYGFLGYFKVYGFLLFFQCILVYFMVF